MFAYDFTVKVPLIKKNSFAMSAMCALGQTCLFFGIEHLKLYLVRITMSYFEKCKITPPQCADIVTGM